MLVRGAAPARRAAPAAPLPRAGARGRAAGRRVPPPSAAPGSGRGRQRRRAAPRRGARRAGRRARARRRLAAAPAPARRRAAAASASASRARATRCSAGSAACSAARRVDEALLEELEALLFGADLGVRTAESLLDAVRKGASGGDADAVRARAARGDARAAAPRRAAGRRRARRPLAAQPHVILVLGVNGSGKTTTIGKLAARYTARGHSGRARRRRHLPRRRDRAAPDLGRARRLRGGGGRAGRRSRGGRLRHRQGRARARRRRRDHRHRRAPPDEGAADGGARQDRARDRRASCPGAPHEMLLVLDANTGQNALSQARLFTEVAPRHGARAHQARRHREGRRDRRPRRRVRHPGALRRRRRGASTTCATSAPRSSSTRSSASDEGGGMSRYVLALDQGTTSSRAMLFDRDGRGRGGRPARVPPALPEARLGRARSRGDLETQLRAARGALGQAPARAPPTSRRSASRTSARRPSSGIAQTGAPIHRAIVWQSRQTAPICEELRAAGSRRRCARAPAS